MRYYFILFTGLFLLSFSNTLKAEKIINPEFGYSYEVPDGWTIKDSVVDGIKYKKAWGQKVDELTPTIDVGFEDIKKGITMEKFVTSFEKELKKQFEGFKVTKREEFKTDSGLKGLKIVAEIPVQGKNVYEINYFFKSRNKSKMFNFTCAGATSKAATCEVIFDKAAQSFNLL